MISRRSFVRGILITPVALAFPRIRTFGLEQKEVYFPTPKRWRETSELLFFDDLPVASMQVQEAFFKVHTEILSKSSLKFRANTKIFIPKGEIDGI